MVGKHDGDYEQVEQELTELLRTQYGVVPSSRDLPSGEQVELTARNRDIIAGILATPVASSSVARSQRNRRAGLLLAASVVLVAGASTAVWLSTDGTSTPVERVQPATPATLSIIGGPDRDRLDGSPDETALTDLANAARRQPKSGLREATLVETASWRLSAPTGSTVTPIVTRILRTPDGDVRVSTTKAQPLTDAGKLGPAPQAPAGFTPTPAAPDVLDPKTLPRDAADLRAALTAADICTDTRAGCLFDAIETLGRSYVLAPSLRAALLQALVGVDDVSYLGTTTDRTERTSAVLATSSGHGDGQRLLLIDPVTGSYSGDESLAFSGDQSEASDTATVTAFHAVISYKSIANDTNASSERATTE